jgi:GAF domain-containing protein/PAS domain-containing protein
MVSPEAAVATRGHRSWAWAGLAAVALIAAIDAFTRGEVVSITAVVIGPFLAAIGATSAVVALVAVVATVVAIVLGLPNDIFLSGDHIIRVGVVAAGGALAVVVTRIREERDAQLRVVGPEAQRLRLALAAGGMGTWRWDLSAGRVVWDAAQEQLFGLQPGSFDGSFDTYAGLLHPEDRDTALAAVRYGMERGTSWQFEHRVVWPDGSVHWLEGRGEPVRDAGGIVGATGISINIDARRFLESRRSALLEAEQRAREAAEQSSGALGRLAVLTAALSAAATVDDVAVTMVHHVNDALEAGYGWFGLVDNATDTIVTRAQEGYPSSALEPFDAVPLSVSIPATEALQTREAIFVESPDDRAGRYPHFRAPDVHGAFVVVPVSPDDDTAGVLSFGFSEPRQFSNEDRQYISAVVEAFSHALRRAALYEAEQTSRERLRTLLDFSELLTGLDDPDAVLQATSQFAATRIGRVASVYAHEIDGTLRRASVAHADPELDRAMRALLMHPFDASEVVRKVAQTRVGVLEQDTSGLVVPIQVSGRSLGVLVVGTDRPAPLTVADLELANDLGRRSASALERVQLWRASQEQLAAEHWIVDVL